MKMECNFCNNFESILTKETCCTGCNKLKKYHLNLEDVKNLTFEDMKNNLKKNQQNIYKIALGNHDFPTSNISILYSSIKNL